MTQEPVKSKWKSFIPVHGHEWPKFLVTSFMMVLVIYVYSILRNSKDALLATSLGAEIISAIKLCGVLPSAILFMLVYTKLADVFTRTKLFHIITWFFVIFLVVFAYILYPNVDKLHFDVSGLIEMMPGLKYLFLMIGSWSFSLFFIMCELWGSVMLSLMFWQLANQITAVPEAKRFYPLFGFFAQIGQFAAGVFAKSVSGEQVDWHSAISSITISIVIAGVLMSVCLLVLEKLVGKETINVTVNKSGKKRVKMGFGQSLKYILSSKYIGLITLLILCYGISINLVEGVWKKSMQMHFESANKYQNFMGDIQIYSSIFTAIAMLCGSYLLRIIKWRTAAMLTPLVILVTGALFFLFMIYRGELEVVIVGIGATPIALAVYFGGTQNVLGKGIKYSFFDPTKEMSYIPLDDDLKSKGKAAADVIGGRLGKSGGAVIQFIAVAIITATDTVAAPLLKAAPLLAVIFLITMVVWFFAAYSLDKEFTRKVAENNEVDDSAAMIGEGEKT